MTVRIEDFTRRAEPLIGIVGSVSSTQFKSSMYDLVEPGAFYGFRSAADGDIGSKQ
jgi:hypothetical protein